MLVFYWLICKRSIFVMCFDVAKRFCRLWWLVLFLAASGCAHKSGVEASILRLSEAPGDGGTMEASAPVQEVVVPDLGKLSALHHNTVEAYVVSKGDKFDLFVYNEPDLGSEDVLVKMDGTLSCKLIGEVNVDGLTLPQAQSRLEKAYRAFIRYPKVSLMPREIKSASFTILGKIKQPGVYYFDGRLGLAGAIAKAQGLSVGIFDNSTIELADLERSFIRRGSDILPVDFVALLRRGNAMMDIPIKNGDYIFIPSAMNQEVYIIGEVEKQGYFGFKPDMTVGRLLAHAEGIKLSASDEVVIIRGNLHHPKIIKVSRKKILSGRMRDVKLEPNDIVYVPKGVLGNWNAVLSQILPSLEAGLISLDLESEISKRADW